MAHSDICCGLYRGSLYLRNKNKPNAALLPVGNTEFTVTQEMTDIEQPNYQSLGGTNCKVSYMNSMNLEMTLHCISPENMALGFLGTSSQLTETTVSNELHAVNAIHELIAFNHVPKKGLAITVTGPSGTPVYAAGTDYKVTNAGIQIIAGSTIPVLGGNIEVDYTYGDNFRMDAATMGQSDYEVVFDGTNYGEGGERPVVIKFHKVKFSPTDSFAVISGEDFANLAVNGQVMKDETVVSGSQFFNVEWGEI